MNNKYILLALYIANTAVVQFFEKYVFADWQFLVFLLILIAVDTIVGFLYAWRTNSLDSEDFSKLFIKVISYLLILILTHVMVHFTVNGQVNNLFGWFNSAAYSSLMIRESLSILKNLGKLYPGLIFPQLLKKLKDFDSDGKPL